MNTLKRILRIFFTILGYPNLVLHELSHAIMGLFLFQKPIDISFRLTFRIPLRGSVNFKNWDNLKGSFIVFLICFAPLFVFISCIVLAFFIPVFKYIVIYQIITIYFTLPSNIDLKNGLEFFKNKHKFTDYKFEKKLNYWLYPKWSVEEKILDEINSLEEKIKNPNLSEHERKEIGLRLKRANDNYFNLTFKSDPLEFEKTHKLNIKLDVNAEPFINTIYNENNIY